DRHLVAVEVGVEGGAHQRVDLDGLALDQHRLERLDAQAVQRRRPVEQDGVLLDDVLEDVPHLRAAALDHPLGRLDVLGQLAVDQRLHDEGLEQLQRHLLGQAALVQLERRADDDDRAARVVDALAQQVLAEPALLALEHVGQRLQRAVAGAGDRPAATAVVEQRVDGLLQHALLVVDDDLGRAEVEEPLQAVVAVDDPAVQVVEVGGREPAAVELDHRPQLRRDDRHDVEDHRPRVVDPPAVLVAAVERGDDLPALDRLLPALGRPRPPGRVGVDLLLELPLLLVEVDAVDELLEGVRAHAAIEVLAVAVLQLPPQHLVLDDLAGVELAELVEGALHQVELLLVPLPDGGEVLLDRLLPVADVGVLGPLGLERRDLLLALLHPARQLELALADDLLLLRVELGLEVGEVLVALLGVDPGDEVGGEVDDLLELLGLQLLTDLGAREQVGQPRAGAAEVPDVDDRRGQLDVAHALAPHLRPGDLDAAALADDALEPDALVLAAVALPVLRRTE